MVPAEYYIYHLRLRTRIFITRQCTRRTYPLAFPIRTNHVIDRCVGAHTSEFYALTTDTNTAPYAYSMRRVLYDFLVTVKAAPHECVIRTGQP